MEISREEAEAALRLIEDSRRTFRAAIGARKGYRHLWLWGGIWVAMALLAELTPALATRLWPWLDLAGVAGSLFLSYRCNRHVRRGPLDRRFITALVMVIVFAVLVWPQFMSGHPDGRAGFAYSALVAMQCYILAGIWFDNALLGVGLVISALILVGYLFFLPIFWWWAAGFGGGGLILSGFYIKHTWK